MRGRWFEHLPRPAWLLLSCSSDQEIGARPALANLLPQPFHRRPNVLNFKQHRWLSLKTLLCLPDFKNLQAPDIFDDELSNMPGLLIHEITEFAVILNDLF